MPSIIACEASAVFLWIPLYTIAIPPKTIIRGLVKIKYKVDQSFLLPWINYWWNIQIHDSWHYNALSKNIDHGSEDTNICLVIIYLSVFFLHIFRSSKLRYLKMLTSGSFFGTKAFLIFRYYLSVNFYHDWLKFIVFTII